MDTAEAATPAQAEGPGSERAPKRATATPERREPTIPGDAFLMDVPLDRIVPSPYQPRTFFDDADIEELAETMLAAGLVQPIRVRPLPDGRFELVAGERRLRAAKRMAERDLSRTTIRAVVEHLTDQQAAIATLVENLARKDLNPIDRANGFKALKKALAGTWEDVGRKVGLTERRVCAYVELLSLPRDVRQALKDRRIHEKHGRAIRLLPQRSEAARQLFEYILADPKRTTGELARRIAVVMRELPGYSPQEALAHLEDWGRRNSLPQIGEGPEATPYLQVLRALKTLNKAMEELDVEELCPAFRRNLSELASEVVEKLMPLVEPPGAGGSS